ncbi:MAG: DUF438 domain-containing protein [Firmicutes bacterium]|nr:DUF438 domain-containing protein [Bacillota bacterium]
MSQREVLVDVLRRLNDPEDLGAKKAAKKLVTEVDPVELSLAEQQLIDEGTRPEELRHLCAIHLEVLGDQIKDFRAKLPLGHPLRTLMLEHEKLLGFLAELEKVNVRIQTREPTLEDLALLRSIADNLIDGNKHHQREEDVLFPALEKLGITGPPRIMRLEHNMLKARKTRLQELLGKELDLEEFRKELAGLTEYIVFNLRDHIFKEDSILYPAAWQTITSRAEWERMTEECDQIGYCSFTPVE